MEAEAECPLTNSLEATGEMFVARGRGVGPSKNSIRLYCNTTFYKMAALVLHARATTVT